jgi:bla regulator protein blaR1
MILALANHIWQSTLFAVAAWLLTLVLRNNYAAVRHAVWLAASVKFLIPFSLLVSLGGQLGWRTAPTLDDRQWSAAIEQIGEPFGGRVAAETPSPESAPAARWIPTALFECWACGFAASVLFWVRCWRRVRAARSSAIPLPLDLPIPAMRTTARMEPGVFGVWRPVLLLPEGLEERLTTAEFDAVIAHEVFHVRRYDNLTGAIHMAVEAIFWFHPLLYWLGARLVEERERACDEAVLSACGDPQVYAGGIVAVCKFYLESPLVCTSGITGSDLKKRVEAIVANRKPQPLVRRKRLLLAAAGCAAIVWPILSGMVNTPRVRAESQAQPHGDARMEFEAAVIKPSDPTHVGMQIFSPGPGRLTVMTATLKDMTAFAYHLRRHQVAGGPGWFDGDKYDITAKAVGRVTNEQLKLMLQSLLATRFQLTFRRETRELPVYELVVAKGAPKLHKVEKAGLGLGLGETRLNGRGATMATLAASLSDKVGRVVRDKTGLTGYYEFTLTWAPEGAPADDRPQPDLFTAVQEQLGLKLEPAKGPVEVLTVDHAAKPSEN